MSRPTIIGLMLCVMASPSFGADTCIPPPALKAKLQPKPTADAYEAIGTWFGERRQFPCAIDAYRAAVAMSPGSARLMYLLGLSLYSSGSTQEAISALEESVATAPDRLKPRLLLAAALEQTEHKAEARQQWEAALKIDPRSTVALHGMAN